MESFVSKTKSKLRRGINEIYKWFCLAKIKFLMHNVYIYSGIWRQRRVFKKVKNILIRYYESIEYK